MASGKTPKNGSNKVGQTLQDLEAAFADWDALCDSPVTTPATTVSSAPSNSDAPTSKDVELRKKTKRLLDQLRQQLAELDD